MSLGPLAIGLVSPGLLAGLGLVAVPIVIHWLSRRRHRRVEWAATRFLLEAERENRRRRQFEQWILLALRCAAMALVALLVARPYVRPGLVAALLGGRSQGERVIVLDDSASLSFRTGTAVELERLKAAAARLLSWLHEEAPRDPVTVYLTSAEGEPLISESVLDEAGLSDLRERLGRCLPTSTPAQPRRVFERIAQRVQAAGRQTDVYVLSDFQRSDWLAAGDPGSASGFEPLRALTEAAASAPAGSVHNVTGGCRVILIASGVQPRDNVALLGLRLERPQTIAGQPAVVHAQLGNFSARAVRDLVLQVQVDSAPLPAVPIEAVDAGAQRDVSLEVTFPDEGYHTLTLTLNPVDPFRADDTRRLAVYVKPALNVLVVDGAPAADARADEVFLLRNALAPSGPLSSGQRVRVIDADQVDGTDLSAFDVVFLCNIPTPRPGAVSLLQAYVQSGGGLVISLGDQVGNPEDYNRALYADGTGLLPLALERLAAPAGESVGVGLVRARDVPVTAMFAGADDTSEYVHFRRYYRCVEAPSVARAEPIVTDSAPAASAPTTQAGGAVVLARYADGERTPALIERPFGRGRVLLFTSTVDLDWNDWARAPEGSFVVTLLEMTQYVARRQPHPAESMAGQPLTVPLSAEEDELRGLFKSPRYPDEPAVEAYARASDTTPDGMITLSGPKAGHLGTYSVEIATRSGRTETRPLCVNLAPRESDLAVATPGELDAALGAVPHQMLSAADDFLRGDAGTRRELWPLLLVLLVVTLTVEQGLAWWFGASHGVRGGRGTVSRGRSRRREYAGQVRT